MTNEEYINELIEIGNVLQIHPNSPKGKALKKAIELLRLYSFPEREKGTDTFFREATKEERESVDKYIKSISLPKREKGTDEIVQAIRTSIATNLYEIAHKFDKSYGDAAIYLQELIDKACER